MNAIKTFPLHLRIAWILIIIATIITGFTLQYLYRLGNPEYWIFIVLFIGCIIGNITMGVLYRFIRRHNESVLN